MPAHIADRLKKEAVKMPERELIDFDLDAFFDNTSTRLIGFIRGYRSDEADSKNIFSHRLSGENQFASLHVNPDGYFEAELELQHPKVHLSNPFMKEYPVQMR